MNYEEMLDEMKKMAAQWAVFNREYPRYTERWLDAFRKKGTTVAQRAAMERWERAIALKMERPEIGSLRELEKALKKGSRNG